MFKFQLTELAHCDETRGFRAQLVLFLCTIFVTSITDVDMQLH